MRNIHFRGSHRLNNRQTIDRARIRRIAERATQLKEKVEELNNFDIYERQDEREGLRKRMEERERILQRINNKIRRLKKLESLLEEKPTVFGRAVVGAATGLIGSASAIIIINWSNPSPYESHITYGVAVVGGMVGAISGMVANLEMRRYVKGKVKERLHQLEERVKEEEKKLIS